MAEPKDIQPASGQPTDGTTKPDPKTVEAYNAGPDLEGGDYDAAGAGTDSLTEGLRQHLRRKYTGQQGPGTPSDSPKTR